LQKQFFFRVGKIARFSQKSAASGYDGIGGNYWLIAAVKRDRASHFARRCGIDKLLRRQFGQTFLVKIACAALKNYARRA
jgi:hypothetical protein